MNETTTHHVHLADGRQLSYSDTGTGDQGTWLHCHGIPGSRYELSHLSAQFGAAGFRVIVPDRPGYGVSSPCKGYDFAQHSADLIQLTDQLGLDSFAVSGFSGGGVFALALAHDLGKHVERLAIAGTPAVPLMQSPFEHASELTAGTWQAALSDVDQLAHELQALTQSADELCAAMINALGREEQQYLQSQQIHPAFHRSIQSALQQGSAESARALARDSHLTARPWPFQVEDIKLPVRIVHGARDQLVHQLHYTTLKNQIPDAEPHLLSHAGHFDALRSIFLSRREL